MRRILLRLMAAVALWLAALSPAQAAITITFWSHELGNSFPHAFITLRGIPDAGGAAVNGNWGFTPVSISPAILMGPVKGKIEGGSPGYVRGSDAQFSLDMSDAQYAAILMLVEEWGERGDPTYRLNSRNCVTFTQEAARRVGLVGLDHPKLMKKPRSYLKAVAAANAGRVTVIDLKGREYLAGLPAIAPPIPLSPAAPVR